jgi:hypothetical protein
MIYEWSKFLVVLTWGVPSTDPGHESRDCKKAPGEGEGQE